MNRRPWINRRGRWCVRLGLSCVCAALSLASFAQPNVVLVLVDDAGLMDFSSYGGEAATPTIDRLAARGVRFSNYHTSPLCAPSRAMLLTGLDNHKTGVATIPEILTDEQTGAPGYELRFRPGVTTIAGRLREQGYETFMTGKWHLGRDGGDLPDVHGFDRSFALDASGADNWEQKSYMPFYDTAPWFEDGVPADLPEDFYSSEFLVDKMVEYLGERDETAPFFAYLAFQAIHIPVQAPREFTERYRGMYSDGWDAVRLRRLERARALGLLPQDAAPPAVHASLRSWDSLNDNERRHYEASMMVNAGMIEAMDFHLGRLVSFLEAEGDLENTIFVITSDNGPENNDTLGESLFGFWMGANGYHRDPERLGERGYMGAIGPEWASAAATPSALFKMYASEGGTRVPLVVTGPGTQPTSEFNPALTFVTDVAPTIAELVGIELDERAFDGRSLHTLLSGKATQVYADEDPVGLEVSGNSALFKGRYKLTRNSLPYGDGQWRLHDLVVDPAERVDLSEVKPALKRELMSDYQRFADEIAVVDLPADFNIQRQVAINTVYRLLTRNWLAVCISAFVVLGLLLLIVRAGVRLVRH